MAARLARVPVVLDGFACTAAAAVLFAAIRAPSTIASSPTARPSPATAVCSPGIGQEPLLDLGMRLGEGSGATLAIAILKAAVACHTGMATFAEAGVSTRAN